METQDVFEELETKSEALQMALAKVDELRAELGVASRELLDAHKALRILSSRITELDHDACRDPQCPGHTTDWIVPPTTGDGTIISVNGVPLPAPESGVDVESKLESCGFSDRGDGWFERVDLNGVEDFQVGEL